jgi:hypothetical protein
MVKVYCSAEDCVYNWNWIDIDQIGECATDRIDLDFRVENIDKRCPEYTDVINVRYNEW